MERTGKVNPVGSHEHSTTYIADASVCGTPRHCICLPWGQSYKRGTSGCHFSAVSLLPSSRIKGIPPPPLEADSISNPLGHSLHQKQRTGPLATLFLFYCLIVLFQNELHDHRTDLPDQPERLLPRRRGDRLELRQRRIVGRCQWSPCAHYGW